MIDPDTASTEPPTTALEKLLIYSKILFRGIKRLKKEKKFGRIVN